MYGSQTLGVKDDRERDQAGSIRPGARPARWALVPAGLSALRLLLAVAFPFTNAVGGIIVVLMAAASDGLDGLLARRWGVTTRWGSVLDAITDKVFLWTALVTLAARGVLAAWTLPLLLVRDLVVVPGVSVAFAARGWRGMQDVDHPLESRLATLAMFLVVICQLALPDRTTLNHLVLAAGIILSMATAVLFLWRFRQPADATVNRDSENSG